MAISTMAQEPSPSSFVSSAVPTGVEHEPTLASVVPTVAVSTTPTTSDPTIMPTFSTPPTQPLKTFFYNGHMYLYDPDFEGDYMNGRMHAMFIKRCGRRGKLAIITTDGESRAVAKHLDRWGITVFVGYHMSDKSRSPGSWPARGKCPKYASKAWTRGSCRIARGYLIEFNCSSIKKCFDKAFKSADCKCSDRNCFVTAAKSTCNATYQKGNYLKPFYQAVDKYFTDRCKAV